MYFDLLNAVLITLLCYKWKSSEKVKKHFCYHDDDDDHNDKYR